MDAYRALLENLRYVSSTLSSLKSYDIKLSNEEIQKLWEQLCIIKIKLEKLAKESEL